MSHPENRYRIEPVYERIKTLEGVRASFPYGGLLGVGEVLVNHGQNNMVHQ